MKRADLLTLFLATAAAAATIDDCRSLAHHGKRPEARACFEARLRDSNPLIRAEAYWGVDRYFEANDEFRNAVKAQPKSAAARVEWGQLYLDHYQPGDAAKLFEEALEIDANYAPAYLALARVAAQGFDKKAVELARESLAHDPKLTEAHEFLAYLALEDNDTKAAIEEAQQALKLSSEALDAMAVLASMDWLGDKPQSEWMDRIRQVNPVYGEAYATGAHFFEINRRYKEAIAYDRKALELDPSLWAARSQLGINLMRLGETAAAKEELERCFDAHHSNPQTRNALRFLDTLKDYEQFQTGTTEVVLDKKEAAVLRPYIEPELAKAIATYRRKYKMTLPARVRLEVYPNHDDFVVRTLGLPGQGGLLGVTFGLVVAMDSPSARPPGEFNWASTMWHELSHVYILTATNNLVPRWFTEGLAVHEEGAASPEWGDRLTPEIVGALKDKKLLPVLELDRGFVRPDYASQVIVSYFEAGKICDYIAQKWGDDAVLGMVHSYAARKTTAEAIQDNLHETPAAFDKDFRSWLDQRTASTVQHFDQWKQGITTAYADLQNGKKDDAFREAVKVRDYYRGYVGNNSVYELTADFYLAKKDENSAVTELEAYREAGGTKVETLTKLARLEQEMHQLQQAIKTLKDINSVYPENAELHRMLGDVLLDTNDPNGAVREFRVLIALKPADMAGAHYHLAKALNAAHRVDEARDEVILALEAAPEFKPAQQLLLELSQP